MYSNSISPKPVIYSIKEVDETASDNKTFQQELKKLTDILKAETETVIDNITVAGIKTLLNIASIAL